MATIHVARAGANLGSFSLDEIQEGLRTGRFLPTDLAWQTGMTDWRPLSEVAAAAPAAAAAAPAPGPQHHRRKSLHRLRPPQPLPQIPAADCRGNIGNNLVW